MRVIDRRRQPGASAEGIAMPMKPPIHRPPGWAPPRKRADPYYVSAEWRAVRLLVLRRDRGICQRCGNPGADTVHHRIERKDGRSDHPSNLEAVHRRCHNHAHPRKGGARD
jgi:5-methylcytosine-specific restriction endonuclease McrA